MTDTRIRSLRIRQKLNNFTDDYPKKGQSDKNLGGNTTRYNREIQDTKKKLSEVRKIMLRTSRSS
jgi:hypothetical protein